MDQTAATLEKPVKYFFELVPGRVERKQRRLVVTVRPALAAGLTRLTPSIEPSLSGWHAGGGIEFGAGERRTVRFEIRDVIPHEFGSNVWAVRIGVGFR
jgi:hypothetical protein